MSTAIFNRDGKTPKLEPSKKRTGVTVTTEHGRAVTFGLPRDRTERILETMAVHKNQGLTAIMLKHKAARLKASQVPPRKNG